MNIAYVIVSSHTYMLCNVTSRRRLRSDMEKRSAGDDQWALLISSVALRGVGAALVAGRC